MDVLVLHMYSYMHVCDIEECMCLPHLVYVSSLACTVFRYSMINWYNGIINWYNGIIQHIQWHYPTYFSYYMMTSKQKSL